MSAFQKRYEKILNLQPATWKEQLHLSNIILPKHCFASQKIRDLALECNNVTDKSHFLFVYAFRATCL